ncbi:putative bifunctional diguanylate cyclase/phosphodiesterase [Halalkalibacterium ligniniphilum]|uniref:putative bifunctional diguanylate cyclase/phosphodiesterase n=1 Tax=Halalkalibacterium ligniniphilum TaxID=1134413 RepID=UPI00034BA9E0|nr:EAL domain-containing protein [Halalkalibacterium ligniniphilum]
MDIMTFRNVAHDILTLLYETLEAKKIYISERDGSVFHFLYGIHQSNLIEYSSTAELVENKNLDRLLAWDGREELEERSLEIINNGQRHVCKPLYGTGKELFGTLTVEFAGDKPLHSSHSLLLMTMAKFLNYTLELRALTIRDTLTGLYNRYFLESYLHKMKNLLQTGYSLIYFDLDDFKYINDSLGHSMGDKLLKQVSADLKEVFSDYFVCRMGGDEFLIFLPWVTEQEVIEKNLGRLKEIFKTPYVINGYEIFLKASVGIASCPSDGETLEEMIRNADTAMYVAKKQGKSQAVYYHFTMNEGTMKRFELESYLNKALDYKEFELYYQPQIELKTGKILGAEALIRWNHPKLGIVSPDVFLELAEETNMITDIGDWVLKTACATCKEWVNQGFSDLKIGVNLSAKQFLQHDLVEKISNVLKEVDLSPHLLDIEITESVSMHDSKLVISILEDLKMLGVKISVDDFGTGYSSLAYLKNFPVDVLKIDRTFIRELKKDDQFEAIVNATIYLAHALRMRVIAEAVETEEQFRYLQERDCDEIQGYFVSKPLTKEEMSLFLEKHPAGKVYIERIAKA